MPQANKATITFNATPVYAGLGVYTKSILRRDKEDIKMLDILEAAGVPETHLISPDNGPNKHQSTATSEFFTGMKKAIEDQYPDQVKALMAMTSATAGNTYVGDANRTTWRNKANSVISGMRTAYIKRLKRQDDISTGKMGANARTLPVEIKVSELLVDARSRIQKADTFKSKMDVDAMVEALNLIIKSIG